jgi:hypothetical protein
MLTVISDHPGFALGIITISGVILGYFIKKVLTKIDTHTEMISELKLDLTTQLSDARINLRKDMTVIFNDTCTERQCSCSRLQQAKLDTLQATHAAICAKLGRLDVERKEAWAEQRRWNDKFETVVYRSTGK